MSDGRPFIPAWLDDLGLSSVQRAVLTHLWRRANRAGHCFPGAASIAKTCRINRNSVWPAIAELERLNLVSRTKGPRNRNDYLLHVGPRQEPAQSDSLLSAQSDSLVSNQKERREGTPLKEPQRRLASVRPRDLLFEELAVSCGSNPQQMTKSAARACGVALAEIREVMPDVSQEEIRRRAAAYRRAHRDWTLTPNALAKHWAEFSSSTGSTAGDSTSREPSNWRIILDQEYPGNRLTSDARSFTDMPSNQQASIIEAFEKAQSA